MPGVCRWRDRFPCRPGSPDARDPARPAARTRRRGRARSAWRRAGRGPRAADGSGTRRRFPTSAMFVGLVHDHAGGRVRLGLGREPFVTYRMSGADRVAARRAVRLMAETFFAADDVPGATHLPPHAGASARGDRFAVRPALRPNACFEGCRLAGGEGRRARQEGRPHGTAQNSNPRATSPMRWRSRLHLDSGRAGTRAGRDVPSSPSTGRLSGRGAVSWPTRATNGSRQRATLTPRRDGVPGSSVFRSTASKSLSR